MAQYHVLPRKDGVAFQKSWKVERNESKLTDHTTKSAAKNKADREANIGDTVVIHGMNGQIQDSYTKSKDRGKQTSKRPKGQKYGLGTVDEAMGNNGFF